MTSDQELNLERFSSLMVELIEKHAGVIDRNEMEDRIQQSTANTK